MDSYLARITPVEGHSWAGDPDYGIPGGGHPGHPLPIPPLPPDIWPQPPVGIWPPPVRPGFPIIIPQPPDKPLPEPPGTIWPPLPPGTGIAGKHWVLIWVVGVGYRWLVIDGPDKWPPAAQPK